MTHYNFYCVVCGEPFKATKKHARTCKTTCRVALSKLMRLNLQDEKTTPTQDEIIAAKVAMVKGQASPIKEITNPTPEDNTPKDEDLDKKPEMTPKEGDNSEPKGQAPSK